MIKRAMEMSAREEQERLEKAKVEEEAQQKQVV